MPLQEKTLSYFTAQAFANHEANEARLNAAPPTVHPSTIKLLKYVLNYKYSDFLKMQVR